MGTIADYNCDTGAMLRLTPDFLNQAGTTFPEAYWRCADMVKTALAVKSANHACFCNLPFCHTMEAEACGGNVLWDSPELGPAAGDPICRNVDELLALPPMQYSSERIVQTLEACRTLRQQGEHVLFSLTGPFTWLNILCGTGPIFKALRKEPEKMQQVFARYRQDLVHLAELALDAGADLIGYSDSVGGLNVLGPKNMAAMAQDFTLPLLQQLQPMTQGRANLLLCPKQSFALIGTDLAVWESLPAGENDPYVHACLQTGQTGLIFGQICAKHYQDQVHGKILVLKLANT